MSERPENRGRKDNYLSVAAAENPSSHRRSTSIGSFTTEVDDDSTLVSINKKPTDRQTKIKLSRLDCLMGVFFPGKAKRKVEKTMVTETVDENEYMNNRGSPWIITVNVLSNDKLGSHFVPKAAQCTVDTGNLQGNTVSREFLLNTLRYPESAIESLKDSEKFGGQSVTGDILMPEGACHLTWYHSKSTQVFRGMRFLISPNPRCDLVIGARSIERHNLLSPPNLMARQAIGDPKDPKYVALRAIEEKLGAQCVNLESDIERAKRYEPDEVEDLEAKLPEKKKLHTVSELDIEYYLARLELAKEDSPENKKLVNDAKSKRDAAVEALPKSEEKETLLKQLENAVATGFNSASNGSASQRHGK